MITEAEIVARFGRLEAHVLQRWIAAGWVKPRESGAGLLFDEATWRARICFATCPSIWSCTTRSWRLCCR